MASKWLAAWQRWFGLRCMLQKCPNLLRGIDRTSVSWVQVDYCRDCCRVFHRSFPDA